MKEEPEIVVVTVYVTGPLKTTDTTLVNPVPDNVSESPGA